MKKYHFICLLKVSVSDDDIQIQANFISISTTVPKPLTFLTIKKIIMYWRTLRTCMNFFGFQFIVLNLFKKRNKSHLNFKRYCSLKYLHPNIMYQKLYSLGWSQFHFEYSETFFHGFSISRIKIRKICSKSFTLK